VPKERGPSADADSGSVNISPLAPVLSQSSPIHTFAQSLLYGQFILPRQTEGLTDERWIVRDPEGRGRVVNRGAFTEFHREPKEIREKDSSVPIKSRRENH
jgi:hypothetical protein